MSFRASCHPLLSPLGNPYLEIINLEDARFEYLVVLGLSLQIISWHFLKFSVTIYPTEVQQRKKENEEKQRRR